MTPLPPYLLNAGRFRHSDEDPVVVGRQLGKWTGAALAEEYLEYQLNRHRATIHVHTPNQTIPSLLSCAMGSIFHYLESSEDLPAAVDEIYRQYEPLHLRDILVDPRISYRVLRTFTRHPEFTMITPLGIRTVVDIDEAVLRNERYIRTLTDIDQKNKYLVDLSDLCSAVPAPAHRQDSIILIRKEPPKGGFEILNAKRERELRIASSVASFNVSFSAFTKDALLGLNWCNVIVAGGVVLESLLQMSDRSRDLYIYEPVISLYIHGLQPDAANSKLHEIHDTWAYNLPPNAEKIVVKSVKAIDLITRCPERSIRIILKLHHSPIDVLLDADLDAGAIGFDGSRVFMLPRCARAIETGYSVLTMDLVWGCPREGRRASSIHNLLVYAERGFGVRILPSYARFLESDILQEINVEELHLNEPQSDVGTDEINKDETQQFIQKPIQMPRETHSREPGLKELKRVARLAEGYVRDLYLRNQSRDASIGPLSEHTLVSHVQRATYTLSEYTFHPHLQTATHIDVWDLDGGFPRRGDAGSDGRGFEVLMRYCELWRLYALGKAKFLMSGIPRAPLHDHPIGDNDLYEYKWHVNIEVQDFTADIDDFNAELWEDIKTAICSKLGINRRDSGFLNYCTRRVRRVVYGSDLASVQEKQITTPVVIPLLLEQYIFSHLPQNHSLPAHFVDSDATKALIPLHDPTRYDSSVASIPSLHDTADESGNLRYWVITNQSMWANQHEVLDEFAELMWCIFQWLISACHADPSMLSFNEPECIWSLARYLRRRTILPEIPGDPLGSLRPGILFKPWVLRRPKPKDGEAEIVDSGEAEVTIESPSTPGYHLPGEYEWHEGDEGDWIGHDVPAWTDDLKRKWDETCSLV